MALYVNNWAHVSCLFSSSRDYEEFFNHEHHDTMENRIYPLAEPEDLYQYIEKRGSKWQDNFTKSASYLARKLCPDEVEPRRLGVIAGTEYGNLMNMTRLSTLAAESPKPISPQLFPNATMSSGTVTAAINIQARGFNATVNSGISSFYQALMLAGNYMEDDKLDACIVLTGDDYNDFAAADLQAATVTARKYLSTMNGVLVTKHKEPGRKNYLINAIDMNQDTQNPGDDIVYAGGYRVPQPHKTGMVPDIYIGPSLGFIGLLSCFKALDERTDLHTCRAIIIADDACSSITVSEENGDGF